MSDVVEIKPKKAKKKSAAKKAKVEIKDHTPAEAHEFKSEGDRCDTCFDTEEAHKTDTPVASDDVYTPAYKDEAEYKRQPDLAERLANGIAVSWKRFTNSLPRLVWLNQEVKVTVAVNQFLIDKYDFRFYYQGNVKKAA